MTFRLRVLALLLAVSAPAIAHAGLTLYDMQHSSVLRQRLPEHLRNPNGTAAAKEPSRTHAETDKPPMDSTKAGASDAATTGTDAKPSKQ
jgi:hypothetical protein